MVMFVYTYERLCSLCKYDNNESEIAHYILQHLDSLDSLTVSKFVSDTGISKASIHRFYNKGGYISFKNLITNLQNEINQRQLAHMEYEKYKEGMHKCIDQTDFDMSQIQHLIKLLKKAKKVAFYGKTDEIACFRELQMYLFHHHIDVIYLDRWDIKSCYQALSDFSSDDVFIMVETSWRIQMIYENSIVNKNLLNLDVINGMPLNKFYIGEADCQQYLTYQNIKISYQNMSDLSLVLLDQKIRSMF